MPRNNLTYKRLLGIGQHCYDFCLFVLCCVLCCWPGGLCVLNMKWNKYNVLVYVFMGGIYFFVGFETFLHDLYALFWKNMWKAYKREEKLHGAVRTITHTSFCNIFFFFFFEKQLNTLVKVYTNHKSYIWFALLAM